LAADRGPEAPDAGFVVSTLALETVDDGLAAVARFAIPLSDLLAHGAGKWTFTLGLNVAGTHYEVPLPADSQLAQLYGWHRGRAFEVSSAATKKGALQLRVQPVARRVAIVRSLRSPAARVGRS
jgi:hypothetical protein